MSPYLSLPHNKKLNLLRSHSFNCCWPDLDQEHWCMHCSQKFNGHSVRVWQDSKGALWLECGTPECDGSPIDWADHPWWDPEHPATIAYLKNPPPPPKGKRGRKKRGDDDDVPF
jgi:hypothetical protein